MRVELLNSVSDKAQHTHCIHYGWEEDAGDLSAKRAPNSKEAASGND